MDVEGVENLLVQVHVQLYLIWEFFEEFLLSYLEKSTKAHLYRTLCIYYLLTIFII